MPEKPNKLLPALYGGIVTGLISGIPFLNFVNCFCCAGVLFGGFLSVFFYTNDLSPSDPQLTSNDSLQLGALSGAFGAIVGTIVSAIIFFSIGNVAGEAMYDAIISIYESAGLLDQLPPGSLESMRDSMVEGGLSPLSIVISFIIDPLFGLLGGLIGYSVFKPKRPMVNIQPPMNPPSLT